MSSEENPEVTVEGEDFSLEIVDEIADEVDKTAELEVEIAALKAKNEELMSAPPVNTEEVGFAALAEELKKMQKPEAPVAQNPGVDYTKVVEDTAKNFYADPTKSVLNLLTPVVTQMQTESDAKLNDQAMQISQLTVLSTPGDKELYIKYKAEVDEVAGGLPPSAQVYQKALSQVKTAHVDDLVNERVQEALKKATEQAEISVRQNAPISLATSPAKAERTKNYSMTTAQWETMQHQAMVKGFEIGTKDDLTADGLWAVERFKRMGKL